MAFNDSPKTISMLVCFEGKNRRIVNKKKKCITNPNHDFSYRALYTADNGKTYMVEVASLVGTRGAKADVTIYNRNGKQIIAERHGVDVRFYRYIF